MTRSALRLQRDALRRGRMIDAGQVAELIGGDPPRSEGWVCRNVPGKIDLGHRTKRWYEEDVLDWIASLYPDDE